MEEITFTLRPNDEFIELNKLLQVMEIAQTGGHAKLLIEDGAVKVNGEVEFRNGDKVAIDHLTITISK